MSGLINKIDLLLKVGAVFAFVFVVSFPEGFFMTMITNNLPSILINPSSDESANQAINPPAVTAPQASPAFTLDLSPEAQAAMASSAAATENSSAHSRRAYDIQANLQIDTPRPDISEQYHIGAARNATTGKVTHSVREVRERFAKEEGEPLDRVLDQSYKELTTTKDITETLRMVQANHEYLGINDYAQEVFFKRSGGVIDLNALYEQYISLEHISDAPSVSSKLPFDIQANLQIDAPRPNISDKYVIAGWNAKTHESAFKTKEDRESFIRSIGDPVDRILDETYNDISMNKKLVENAELNIATNTTENIDNAISNLTELLSMVQANNDYYGISDYAQEVFSKRSGGMLDLQALYQKYLG